MSRGFFHPGDLLIGAPLSVAFAIIGLIEGDGSANQTRLEQDQRLERWEREKSEIADGIADQIIDTYADEFRKHIRDARIENPGHWSDFRLVLVRVRFEDGYQTFTFSYQALAYPQEAGLDFCDTHRGHPEFERAIRLSKSGSNGVNASLIEVLGCVRCRRFY